MKKILYTFCLILFANIGYSQLLPTGTSTTDNKYRSGGLGVGYTSLPSFGTNKLLVNRNSVFTGGIRLNIESNDIIPQFQIFGTGGYANGSIFQIGLAGGDYHWSNVSKKGDIIIRGNTGGSLIIANEQHGNIKFATRNLTDGHSKTTMLIDKDGKVGIGAYISQIPTIAGSHTVNTYRLFVKGGILTEQIRVVLANEWADYVFEENYNLLKLEEVEEFIKKYKHLPNVPSATEVSESGIELGEMTKIQQEKIEELTLYIIEQNKTNKKQQEEINELK